MGARLVPEVIEFEIFGKPTPKSRPRFTRTGRTYTDAKTKAAETAIAVGYLNATTKRVPHDGPVEIELLATFAPAPSWPKKRIQKALAGELDYTSRPDVDNLLKIIDGLNGRAWSDDAQIIRATVIKRYGEQASMRFRITLHETERNN